MVLRHERTRSFLLPLLLTAGAAVFAARCFLPGVAGGAGGAHKQDNVGQRRQLFLKNALLAGLGIGASMEKQEPASADFLATYMPNDQYKKMELKNEKLQNLIQAEVGDNLGRIMNLKDQCFESDKKGFTAQVSTDTVLVWDPTSGKCPDGQSFVHAAGRSEFFPMTSEKGPAKHTYFAAGLEDQWKNYKGKEGTCVPTPTNYQYDIHWEVASTGRGAKCAE